MKYSLILCDLNFHYEKQQQWRIKGGGAEWAKARSPHHLSAPNPKIYMFLILFLIRDRAPF